MVSEMLLQFRTSSASQILVALAITCVGQFHIPHWIGGQERPVAADDINVDTLIVEHFKHDARLLHYDCRFSARVCVVANSEQLVAAEGELQGNASGRILRKDRDSALIIDVGDTFRMQPFKDDGTLKRFTAPFPGAHVIYKSNKSVLRLNAMTGSGEIGRRDDFVPTEMFNPFRGLGVVAGGKYTDPLNWLVDPPDSMKLTVSLDGSIAKVVGLMGQDMVKVDFDLEHGCMVSFFSLGTEIASAKFHVDEFVEIADGVFFPKRTRGIFASGDEFPKRCIFWSADEVRLACDDTDLALQLGGDGWTIADTRNRIQSTWLPASSILTPAAMEKLVDAIENRRPEERSMLPFVWPKPSAAPVDLEREVGK